MFKDRVVKKDMVELEAVIDTSETIIQEIEVVVEKAMEVAEEVVEEVVEEAEVEVEEDLAVVAEEVEEDLAVVAEVEEVEDLVVAVAVVDLVKVIIEHLKLHLILLIQVVLLNLKAKEKFFD